MTESQIQKQIIDYLKLSGYLVFRMNSGKARNNIRLCPPGTPDLLAINGRKNVWIEVKTKNGKLNEDQIYMHDELARRYEKVIVVRSLNDVREYI